MDEVDDAGGGMMLSAAELADMRSIQALTFDQSATVTRRTYTDDDAGGQTTSDATHSLPCRIAPASGAQQQMLGGQYAEMQTWRITFAAGADVRLDDRLAVAGHNLEVVAVLGAESRETARVTLGVVRI